MLFNSPGFVFGFMPVVLLVFFLLQRSGLSRFQTLFLFGASLFFYGWWSVAYLPLLLFSIGVNYAFGQMLARRPKKWLLALAIGIDLALLGYFKYANFGAGIVGGLLGQDFATHVILPLGISFYTFTQIAYLVDSYQGKAVDRDPGRYGLFVTFFPHLIAGPILHHDEMTRQFRDFTWRRVTLLDLTVGATAFSIGMCKKTVIADRYAPMVGDAFGAVAHGTSIGAGAAWAAVLGYTLQLYFDFSGYCDMAIGLSRMIGIRLPQNFNSPYKSASIAEFWTRWHMTLSRFLRDYLYIPLGGNRNGDTRSHVNVMITMLLGGLWHGAGWTFVLWGGLHGFYIVTGRLWNKWSNRHGVILPHLLGAGITFFFVVLAWVPFRSENLHAAFDMFRMLSGGMGFGGGSAKSALLIGGGLALVWLMPNSQEMLARYRPVLSEISPPSLALLEWRPTLPYAAAFAILLVVIVLFSNHVSEFLYFQF